MATIPGKSPDEPKIYSVGQLLRRQMGDDRHKGDDPWDLAVVQRDEVWGSEGMKQLLDSLLAGYPMGALLLCQTTREEEPSYVIERDADGDEVREAGRNEYQLLDGQQRLSALRTMLTTSDEKHRDEYGRLYLDLTESRQDPTPAHRGVAIPYLVWQEESNGDDGDGADDKFATRRPRCLDLSRLYDWAEVEGGLARGDDLLKSGPEVLAHDIDPQFTHALDAREERDQARDWLWRILRMWRAPIVPAIEASVDAPGNVLELFARLNRAGVRTSDTVIYFAAVKTFWRPDAAERLKLVIEASGPGTGGGYAFLTMERALRLISRLAGLSTVDADPIPLRVQNIVGGRLEKMDPAMTALTSVGSPVLELLGRFFEDYRAASELNYGLRYVNEHLWDEVLGWAVTRGHWDEDDLRTIDAYLFGGTLFGYYTIFSDPFSKRAFVEALAAGVHDKSFPLREIIYWTRRQWPGLRRGRSQVRALEPSEENFLDRELLRRSNVNTRLLLSIAQSISVEYEPRLDVDHIYPKGLEYRMKWRPEGWKVFHRDREWINSIGNKWWLPEGTNRSLKKGHPEEKFRKLVTGSLLVWPRKQWSICEWETEAFSEVYGELGNPDDTDRVDRAMRRFRDVVEGRADRLLDAPFAVLRDARLFARDAEPALVEPPDGWEHAEAPSPAELAERLGLP